MRANRAQLWGWHELDSRWANSLVAKARVTEGDLVLDIGAGTGALTEALVSAGARVIAVELHPDRAAYLEDRFSSRQVTVVRADASNLRLPGRPFKVVSNPPFSVTAAVLKRLLSPGSRLSRADLILPWHVARRWDSAGAPGRGRWGAVYSTRLGRPPPRCAFRPPPPNDVGLLVVELLGRQSHRG